MSKPNQACTSEVEWYGAGDDDSSKIVHETTRRWKRRSQLKVPDALHSSHDRRGQCGEEAVQMRGLARHNNCPRVQLQIQDFCFHGFPSYSWLIWPSARTLWLPDSRSRSRLWLHMRSFGSPRPEIVKASIDLRHFFVATHSLLARKHISELELI